MNHSPPNEHDRHAALQVTGLLILTGLASLVMLVYLIVELARNI